MSAYPLGGGPTTLPPQMFDHAVMRGGGGGGSGVRELPTVTSLLHSSSESDKISALRGKKV